MEAAGLLIREYGTTRKGLHALGILRSNRSLQDDYAEWLVVHMLPLSLCRNPIQKGYDAQDAEGRRYKVRSRIVESLQEATSFDFGPSGSSFDYPAAVFFNKALDVLGIVLAPSRAGRDHCRKTKSHSPFSVEPPNCE